jgi:hypothetical protein
VSIPEVLQERVGTAHSPVGPAVRVPLSNVHSGTTR